MKRCLQVIGPFAVILLLATSCNQQMTTQQTDRQMKPPEIRRYVSVAALNLRECPGSACRIIRVLEQGDSGLVIGEDSGWVEMLIDRSDTKGWVAGKYLSEQPVARPERNKSNGRGKNPQPPLPEETFAEPQKVVPPPLQEELAGPEADKAPGAKTAISEEFAD